MCATEKLKREKREAIILCLIAEGEALFIVFRALSVIVTMRENHKHAIGLLRDILIRRADPVRLGQNEAVKEE